MSLLGYKKHVEEGDTVIVFFGHESTTAVTIKKGEIKQTKYGALRHNDIIGKKFGSKIQTVNQRGWVYILHPTPELWTVNLPHRTQILYFADISMITMQLELKPGSLVIESGTGSGSMSHCLARTISPNGHLYTFEFHEQRTQIARAEFKQHGLGDIVTVEHRDVCETGFGLDLKVDAVFLDLPSPHLTLAHAKTVLKSDGGRICSFSPCIEQVQRTCLDLKSHGFSDVMTVECLLRNYDTRTIGFPIPNLGLDQVDAEASHRSDQMEKQLDVNKSNSIESEQQPNSKCDRKSHLNVKNGEDGVTQKEEVHSTDTKIEDSKKTGSLAEKRNLNEEMTGGSLCSDSKKFKRDNEWKVRKAKATSGQYALKCAVPNRETPGHTGYLTFATLFDLTEK